MNRKFVLAGAAFAAAMSLASAAFAGAADYAFEPVKTDVKKGTSNSLSAISSRWPRFAICRSCNSYR